MSGFGVTRVCRWCVLEGNSYDVCFGQTYHHLHDDLVSRFPGGEISHLHERQFDSRARPGSRVNPNPSRGFLLRGDH